MKSIEQVKAQVKKLFAMVAEGSGASQQEVESALKAARTLMAKYKLADADILEKKDSEVVVTKILDDVTYTAQTNIWVGALGNVIASNYCCHYCVRKMDRTYALGFIGFSEDTEIAETVLRYAYSCIMSDISSLKNIGKRRGRSAKELTDIANAYGQGYVMGIRDAFEEQNKATSIVNDEGTEVKTSYALVLQVPAEVKNYVKNNTSQTRINMNKSKYEARDYSDYTSRGYNEGRKFSTRDRLAG